MRKSETLNAAEQFLEVMRSPSARVNCVTLLQTMLYITR